jgi:hypothetical protein
MHGQDNQYATLAKTGSHLTKQVDFARFVLLTNFQRLAVVDAKNVHATRLFVRPVNLSTLSSWQ